LKKSVMARLYRANQPTRVCAANELYVCLESFRNDVNR
jgi:hypothetical protein